ncbi:chromosome segregation protein SMC [bacterium]|nr:chromosome segregation protein SMC [bacterium]
MRIKQLELVGFKSFPQRTVLDFPSGVTGVVGPNGCGKSNIVDAIRWVLGEQSPKHLRGDAMEAVIFNGNERQSPLGMAEVSLTFDNDRPLAPPSELDLEVSTLPAHIRELPEITITRRYFRSGEAEYLINRMPCRLKDITELFLGTGVGSKAYAIIEQGRVEQLINAKPEDRRLFIEEAAGTTLYRARKQAAERKMERTRENLSRVNDILHEIDRQTQYLERQAKKAEAHKRLVEELRGLELRVSGRQWQALQRDLAALDATRERLAGDAERLRGELDANQDAHQAAAAAVADAEHRHAAAREQLAVLEAERLSVQQRIAMLEEQRAERERRSVRLGEDADAARAAQATTSERVRQAEREREASAQYLAFDEGELLKCEEALAAGRNALATLSAALEAAKGALVEHVTREVEVRNGLASLTRRREEIARQLDKLRGEERALEQRREEIDAHLTTRRADLERLRGELAQATGEQEARANELRALAEARRRWERQAVEVEGVFVQAGSRLASLEQIQSNYEGYHRGVRAIMREEQHPDGVLGVVADVIDIPQQYERAVAAVLGERLQYVIVRGEEEGAEAVDRLRQEAMGRSSFIPLQPRVPDLAAVQSLNGTSRQMLDLVRVRDEYRSVAQALLGEVVLVPDLATAIAMWRQHGVRVTLVTPDGDVLDPSGVITGGSDRPIEEELLARRREIEQLRESAARSGRELAEVRAQLEEVGHAMTAAETAVQSLGEGAHQLTVQIVAAEKDIERLEIERPQCCSRRDVVRYEIESLLDEERAAAADEVALRQRHDELARQHQALEQALIERRAETDEAVARAEALTSQVTTVKVRVAERRERQAAAAAAVEALRRQQRELDERLTALQAEREQAEGERATLEQDVATARAREVEQVAQRAALEAAVAAGAVAVEAAGGGLRAAEQRGRELQAAIDELRTAQSQAEIARSEARLRGEHLVGAMREKYEVDLATLEPVASDEDVNEEEERARVDAVRQRLLRLGEVNVGAIDELREFEERGTFLRTQRDDLQASLADLERTIQKLNRASRTKFAETFAKANETFQRVFPRLFRGGEGKLVLTNEHDLLESGVEIVVRPPGKRLDTVSLLSGGEKALVAVSLIFSLFLINPTPFCILDEVDAPLDDANIGRYSQMIKEMSAHSQFILITHNKRTMESADILYGVTMQEPGVSKVISVAIN